MAFARVSLAVVAVLVGACGARSGASGAGGTSEGPTASGSTAEASGTSTSWGTSTSEPVELCGNGLLDPGEACDPAGENVDGCSPDCAHGCIALEWMWQYDEPYMRGVTTTDDGTSAILAGFEEQRVTVLTPEGIEAWTRVYDRDAGPYGNPLAFDLGRRLWVAGEQTDPGIFLRLRRYSVDGELELDTEVPGATLHTVAAARDGAIVLGGMAGEESWTADGPWIALADANGAVLWERNPVTEGGAGDYVAAEVVASDGSGNVLTLVSRTNLASFIHLVKLSPEGDQIWGEQVGSSTDFVGVHEWPTALAIDGEDGIVLVGMFPQEADGPMLMVERFDTDGTRLWHDFPGGQGVAVVNGVDIVTAGDPEDRGQILVQRLTLDGEVLCKQWIGFAGHERTQGGDVAAVPGGVIVAGVLDPGGTFVARFSVHD